MARLKSWKIPDNFFDAQALNQMIPVEASLPNCEIETKLNFREKWMRNVENKNQHLVSLFKVIFPA